MRIPLMALLLAVLQPLALVVLEQAVLGAEVAGAEAAVARDTLGGALAVAVAAPDLLGRHPAGHGGEVDGGAGHDVEVGHGRVESGEVLAGEDEAESGRRQVGADGEQALEGADGGCGRDGEGYCCAGDYVRAAARDDCQR